MKKLTLVTLISGALSASAFAGGGMDKDKIESTFAELDNDRNGYITQEEADDDDIADYFAKIDSDTNKQLSRDEFNTYLTQHGEHFEDDISQTARTGSETDSSNEYGMQEDSTSSRQGAWDAGQERQDRSVARTGQNDGTMAQSENDQSMAQSDDEWSSNSQQQDTDVVARNEFDMMDADKDGQLSKAEASRSGVNASFEDIDENGDQLVTRVEYTDYRQNSNYDYDDEE